MSRAAARAGAPVAAPSPAVPPALPPTLDPAVAADLAARGAVFADVVHAPGLPPFVVWSRRPLGEAATDALADARRCLHQGHALPPRPAVPPEPHPEPEPHHAPSRPSYQLEGIL